MNQKMAWQSYRSDQSDRSDLSDAPDRVPNGSFGIGNGPCPDGWRLVHGALGESTEWQRSGGVDGGRCLRISPRGGGASWACDTVPVSASTEYLFRCAIKRDGERHWAHACAINWVSLVFLDDNGQPCKSDAEATPFVIVRCRKTADWVEGWRWLHAPANARALRIGFRIERGEPDLDDAHGFRSFWHSDIDTGNWWIDDVRLDRMPLEVAPGQGRLTIKLAPGGARLRIADQSGKTHTPPGTATYAAGPPDGGKQSMSFHALREDVDVALPPGTYLVEATRGFQRRPFATRVEVKEGAAARVELDLPRTMDLPAQGWYDGDHHNHLSFHGDTRHPLLTIDDVYRIARGEGLDYVSFCGEIVDQHAYADWRDAGRPADARPDGTRTYDDFVAAVSHEVTQDLLGHLCLVNAPGHVAPGHPWWIAPTNAEVIEQVRKGDGVGTQGAVVLAHPYDGLDAENLFHVLADPERTGLNRELPVDVALGLADTMDFLVPDSSGNLDLRFRDYFRLLNLGFRIGVSASSDAYVDQGTEIIGGVRTMVRAVGLSMDSIALGYRRQQTIATNGPILMMTVNGAGIGDTVIGPRVRISAWAQSHWGITRLEVIAGGEVVADATPGTDGRTIIETELSFDRSQWLVARAWGPSHPALNALRVPNAQRGTLGQWAVTSPIHVLVEGRPISPRADDATHFIRWIDASCDAIRCRKAFLEGRGPHGPVMRDADVAAALDLFDRGRKIYERLLRAIRA